MPPETTSAAANANQRPRPFANRFLPTDSSLNVLWVEGGDLSRVCLASHFSLKLEATQWARVLPNRYIPVQSVGASHTLPGQYVECAALTMVPTSSNVTPLAFKWA